MKSIYPIMIATAASTTTVSVVTFETMTPTEKIQSLTKDIEKKEGILKAKTKDLQDKKDRNQKELKAVQDIPTRKWLWELAGEMRAKTITKHGDNLEIFRHIKPYIKVRKQLTIPLYKLEKYGVV